MALLPLKEKTEQAGSPRRGEQTAFALPCRQSGIFRVPTRPQPRSPCLSARRCGPERQPIACRDHFRSWKLNQSKRSVLKRPVRIQDVCAHALLVADGDFFLCSGPLWYRAEPEDYAGPDSPRSEWKRPGGNPGGRRDSRTPRSRSPRVTRHGSGCLVAYIPEWPEGFEPITFRQFTTIPVPSGEMFAPLSHGVELHRSSAIWGKFSPYPSCTRLGVGRICSLQNSCEIIGGSKKSCILYL